MVNNLEAAVPPQGVHIGGSKHERFYTLRRDGEMRLDCEIEYNPERQPGSEYRRTILTQQGTYRDLVRSGGAVSDLGSSETVGPNINRRMLDYEAELDKRNRDPQATS